MNERIRQQLFQLSDEKYRTFSASLIPNVNNMLGVRLPELRKIAKQISKGDWRTYLHSAEHTYFEEVMLQGMVIGYAKTDIEEILLYIESFIPKIDNWSVCDSFCSGLKITKKNKERMWEFIQRYLRSNEQFPLRFAIVMLLTYYVEENYLERVLALLDRVKHEGYYVKMAVAWAISICFIKFPQQTAAYLKQNRLDDFTYHKSLQKIIESHRVDKETKAMIRQLKRR